MIVVEITGILQIWIKVLETRGGANIVDKFIKYWTQLPYMGMYIWLRHCGQIGWEINLENILDVSSVFENLSLVGSMTKDA